MKKDWKRLEKEVAAAIVTVEQDYLIINGCKKHIPNTRGLFQWGIDENNKLICNGGAEQLARYFEEYRQDQHPYFQMLAINIYESITK